MRHRNIRAARATRRTTLAGSKWKPLWSVPLARLQNNPSWLGLPCQFRNTAIEIFPRPPAEPSDPKSQAFGAGSSYSLLKAQSSRSATDGGVPVISSGGPSLFASPVMTPWILPDGRLATFGELDPRLQAILLSRPQPMSLRPTWQRRSG